MNTSQGMQVKSDRLEKIYIKDLRIGMYVVELDRPWLESPFLVQGFVIKSVQELEVICDLCSYVYVDVGLSKTFHTTPKTLSPTRKALTKERLERMLNVRIAAYEDSVSFAEELVSANKVYSDYDIMVTRFYDDVRATRKVDTAELREPVNKIVESIIRNPDACMLLTKLKRKGDYTYNHAIGSSVWAAAMGRQLGLPKHVMISMSIGALLLDVGKLQVPDQILNKLGPLTVSEIELTKKHLEDGVEMLRRTKGVDKIVFQMVLTHHERHNGKGYPRGLAEKDIPVYGRIAGIVDTYDALINDKPYRIGMAASEAIRVLYNVRDVDFQAELVEEFIQALGVYPAGSMVELTNGEVGIVVAEHRNRRLRPRLLMLLNADKNPISEKKYLDLHKVTRDHSGNLLEIAKSLNPGEYGLITEDILV